MGYQEYVYKIDNIKNFTRNRKRINDFIDKYFYESVDYCIVDFKKDIEGIKKGIYMYTFGDRNDSRLFLNYLDKELIGISSYVKPIEEALNIESFGDCNTKGDKLITLFNDRSTSFARVVYEKESIKQTSTELERSLF